MLEGLGVLTTATTGGIGFVSEKKNCGVLLGYRKLNRGPRFKHAEFFITRGGTEQTTLPNIERN